MNKFLFPFFVFFGGMIQAQDSLVIFFGFDRYSLSNETRSQLVELKNSGATIEAIHGFTDTCGSVTYNKWLAEKRIASVVNQLKSKSISENHAFGEEFLFAKNNTENRKVVIIYKSIVSNTITPKKETITTQLSIGKVGEKIRLKSLNFYPGLADLLPQSISILVELLEAMNSNKKLQIEIQGHICCAPADYDDLSTARAAAVYHYLVSKGVDAQRMSYKGFGVSLPLYPMPEKTEEERSGNRRVEIKIISN